MNLLLTSGLVWLLVMTFPTENLKATAPPAGYIPHDSIFILKGKISGQKKGFIKLIYTDRKGNFITDSCEIRKGKFQFRGSVSEPTKVYLEGAVATKDINDPNFTSFFIEPGTMQISLVSGEFRKARISGSKTQDEQTVYDRAIAPVLEEMQPLNRAYEVANRNYRQAVKAKKDEAALNALLVKLDSLRSLFEPYTTRVRQIEQQFFRQYPQSFVTAFQLRFHVSDLSLDSLQAFYDRLGPVTRLSVPGMEIGKQLRQLRQGSPGSMAPEFSAADIEGKQVSLSDYKGKYVLLDFWASWCVPCRKGNPHLKELYAKYRDRGIEFIGIADDDREAAKWKDAVAKDGIGHWKHVLRGLRIENNRYDHSRDISEKYGIHVLPTKILIDPSGMIIGRFHEDEAPLDAMLKETFGF